MAQLNRDVGGISGVRRLMQAVQDINIGGRLTAAEYQYTLTDPSLNELNKWGDCLKIGGQAAFGTGADESLAGWNFCP